jgi:rod shape-determining protein MreD
MAYLISLPIMIVALMLQEAIFSQLPLMSGTADLVLLILIAWAIQPRNQRPWVWALVGGGLTSLVSAMPAGTPVLIYLLIVLLARRLQRQTIEIPILGMFIATILGTFIQHLVEVIILFVAGTSLSLTESLSLVTLPSVLLNLLFALPIYVIITDLANRFYPMEIEV